MVDSIDTYKSLISKFRNSKMLKFIPDHLKTKQMCNCAIKKIPFLIRYVPDQDKTKNMCNRAFLKNGGMLESVPNRYKTQKCVTKLLIIMLMH